MTDTEFALNVKQRFAFLESQFAFQCDVAGQDSSEYAAVRYTSRDVSLEVFLDRMQGNEVGVRFWLSADTSRDYSYHTYLQLVDLPTARSLGYSMAKDDAEIRELLSFYQDGLQSHGRLLLEGDRAEFERTKRAEEDGFGLTPFEPSSPRFCGDADSD